MQSSKDPGIQAGKDSPPSGLDLILKIDTKQSQLHVIQKVKTKLGEEMHGNFI